MNIIKTFFYGSVRILLSGPDNVVQEALYALDNIILLFLWFLVLGLLCPSSQMVRACARFVDTVTTYKTYRSTPVSNG